MNPTTIGLLSRFLLGRRTMKSTKQPAAEGSAPKGTPKVRKSKAKSKAKANRASK